MKGIQYYSKEEVVKLFEIFVPLVNAQCEITEVDINDYRPKEEYCRVLYEDQTKALLASVKPPIPSPQPQVDSAATTSQPHEQSYEHTPDSELI